jgi:hypothetical protein
MTRPGAGSPTQASLRDKLLEVATPGIAGHCFYHAPPFLQVQAISSHRGVPIGLPAAITSRAFDRQWGCYYSCRRTAPSSAEPLPETVVATAVTAIRWRIEIL